MLYRVHLGVPLAGLEYILGVHPPVNILGALWAN